ncbi:MAG: N-acetyltransferase [Alphaproteobacteria bacterium]|nr:N-acetyltransferase [Alphaproteobacteria bacterium]
MDAATLRAAVVDVPARSRFELALEGGTAFVDYRLAGDIAIVPHTEVPPAFEGQGVGRALVLGALDGFRARGLKVQPRCSFFARVAMRDPAFADMLVR